MEKVLIVDTDRCTGCRLCQLACSQVKYGEFNPRKSYIQVMKNKDFDINIVGIATSCDYCGECVRWCLPNALKFMDLNKAIIKWKGVKLGSFPAILIGNPQVQSGSQQTEGSKR